MATIMRTRDTLEDEDPFADLVPVPATPLVSPLEYGSGIAGVTKTVSPEKEDDATDRTEEETTSSEKDTLIMDQVSEKDVSN
jgi:hypothetical protein